MVGAMGSGLRRVRVQRSEPGGEPAALCFAYQALGILHACPQAPHTVYGCSELSAHHAAASTRAVKG